MKSEQLKVIANTFDDERAQTLQQNRRLQEQLDLAQNKYDVVHSKLDTSVELSTNRSAQFDNMQADLLNVTQSNTQNSADQRQSISEHND